MVVLVFVAVVAVIVFALLLLLLLFLLNAPAHEVFVKDGSTSTVLRSATLRQKLQVQLALPSQPQHTDTGPTSPVPGPQNTKRSTNPPQERRYSCQRYRSAGDPTRIFRTSTPSDFTNGRRSVRFSPTSYVQANVHDECHRHAPHRLVVACPSCCCCLMVACF